MSGNNLACIEKLQPGSKITVRQENDNLVSYDANGTQIDTVPTNDGSASFYSKVESKVNYYNLLDSTYSSNKSGSKGSLS